MVIGQEILGILIFSLSYKQGQSHCCDQEVSIVSFIHLETYFPMTLTNLETCFSVTVTLTSSPQETGTLFPPFPQDLELCLSLTYSTARNVKQFVWRPSQRVSQTTTSLFHSFPTLTNPPNILCLFCTVPWESHPYCSNSSIYSLQILPQKQTTVKQKSFLANLFLKILSRSCPD